MRNPVRAIDVTENFRDSTFAVFAKSVAAGNVVRAIVAPGAADKSRSFFDKTVEVGQSLGLAGVAYLVLADQAKGPLAKFVSEEARMRLGRKDQRQAWRRDILRVGAGLPASAVLWMDCAVTSDASST